MPISQETHTQSATEQVPGSETPITSGPLFVSACLIVPVLWGVIVHQVFKRIRKKIRPDAPSSNVWPDYQI